MDRSHSTTPPGPTLPVPGPDSGSADDALVCAAFARGLDRGATRLERWAGQTGDAALATTLGALAREEHALAGRFAALTPDARNSGAPAPPEAPADDAAGFAERLGDGTDDGPLAALEARLAGARLSPRTGALVDVWRARAHAAEARLAAHRAVHAARARGRAPRSLVDVLDGACAPLRAVLDPVSAP